MAGDQKRRVSVTVRQNKTPRLTACRCYLFVYCLLCFVCLWLSFSTSSMYIFQFFFVVATQTCLTNTIFLGPTEKLKKGRTVQKKNRKRIQLLFCTSLLLPRRPLLFLPSMARSQGAGRVLSCPSPCLSGLVDISALFSPFPLSLLVYIYPKDKKGNKSLRMSWRMRFRMVQQSKKWAILLFELTSSGILHDMELSCLPI